MKKRLYLILALIIYSSAIGYAFLSESLSAVNSVSTGVLDVVFEDDDYYPHISDYEDYKANPRDEYYNERKSEIVKSQIINTGKSVQISIFNLFPGSNANCLLKIKNKGTIPAKIENIKVDFQSQTYGDLLNIIKVKLGYYKYTKDNKISIRKNDNNIYLLRDLQSAINNLLKDVDLKPEEYILIGLPEGYEYSVSPYRNGINFFIPISEKKGMNSAVEFTITVNAVQATKLLN